MSVKNPDTLRLELQELKRATGKGWREIAQLPQYSPVPFGTLSAIANGYPVPKRWHGHFGIVDPIPVVPCPIHGVVHDYDCRSQIVKPLRKPSRPRPARIAIRKDDMGKAARSIKNNLTPAQVRELKELL